MNRETCIGVDIGGSHVVCCGVDLRTETLISGTQFERKLDRKGSQREIFTAWAEPINQTIKALGGTAGAGIGFAMPGSFNYRTGVALFAGNDKYESLYNVDVQQVFAPFLSVKNVPFRFINDATAFGIGTAYLGEKEGRGKLIAITLGTGFGSTFNNEGIPVMKGENIPPHGSLWHLPFENGIADDYFSTRWFVNTYLEITGNTVPGVKEIAELAHFDQQARQLFDTFGANLARFLGSRLCYFEVQKLVIGGNIARAWNLMEPAFLRNLNEENAHLKTEVSLHMETAAILGSAKLLDDAFWNQVKGDLPEK